MVLRFVVHENSGDVLGVEEVAHGRERDHYHSVVVIVATLHLVLVNADNLESDAVDADALADSLFAGKKSSLRFVADHGHAGVLREILLAQAAAGGDVEAA